MNADFVLSKLDKVRISGGDKWTACCPAHDDKSPSLSVTDKGDKILLKCWSGCTFEEIAGALGIKPQQLFSDCGTSSVRPIGPSRSAIEAIASEAVILYFWANDRLNRKPEAGEERERVRVALQRLANAGRYFA